MKQEPIIQAAEFVRDVRWGLTETQKQLPSQYLYDSIGSALFEVITLLPEYGLTRADERLLGQHARELPRFFATTPVIAELGSGTGVKTRRVLSAFERAAHAQVLYFPIDISVAALERCELDLRQFESVHVDPLASSYIDGLGEAIRRTPHGAPVLLLFLGSTIGNFDRDVGRVFLRKVRELLRTGDVLFLGTDLVKPVPQLLAAYDDPIGVTAAFNMNLLSRINNELGGDFDLSMFRHVVRYHQEHRRIEMHLESLADQTVRVEAAGLRVRFIEGETIWTESSHKFTCAEVQELATEAEFSCEVQWVDQEWPFAENVLVAV
jgi:dimethylhistidine N-methyltransferase